MILRISICQIGIVFTPVYAPYIIQAHPPLSPFQAGRQDILPATASSSIIPLLIKEEIPVNYDPRSSLPTNILIPLLFIPN